MLTNIRTETPYTLVGGAALLQPTLKVFGYATIDIVATGNSRILGELLITTPRQALNRSVTNYGTNFAAAWAQSYDSRPTGFEAFPDTSLLQNYAFWSGKIAGGDKVTKRVAIKVGVGRPKRYTFRFATRTFRFEDYSSGGFLTTPGAAPGKSYTAVFKLHGEKGQVCGVKSAVNQPILTEIGAMYMVKVRSYYFYRFVAGNNRPTIYGSNLGTNETVNEDALSWIGVPALRAQRYNVSFDVAAGYPEWGGASEFTRQEVNINPTADCAGGLFTPTVI